LEGEKANLSQAEERNVVDFREIYEKMQSVQQTMIENGKEK